MPMVGCEVRGARRIAEGKDGSRRVGGGGEGGGRVYHTDGLKS